MNRETCDHIIDDQIEKCLGLLRAKREEYATENPLHNFEQAANLLGVKARQALGGMMAKHIISLYDMIQKEAPANISVWDEKIGDSINYLLLLKAVVLEELSTVLNDTTTQKEK
jgi:hypothetical protein